MACGHGPFGAMGHCVAPYLQYATNGDVVESVLRYLCIRISNLGPGKLGVSTIALPVLLTPITVSGIMYGSYMDKDLTEINKTWP